MSMTFERERELDKFVEREVWCNVTGLVGRIWELDTEYDDCIPRHKLDYRTAAEENGWELDTDGMIRRMTMHFGVQEVTNWEDACETSQTQPYEQDIYQWYAVTAFLADELVARGEIVMRDFYGLEVWGRTTFGQAISMDSVIVSIYNDLHSGGAE